MNNGWFNIPWFYYGIACVLIASAYLIFPVAPHKDFRWNSLPIWKYFVLRWLHSMVWILLFLAGMYLQVNGLNGEVNAKLIALAGFFCYVIYLLVFIWAKRKANILKKESARNNKQ